jgi:flavorubredoxin
VCSSDLYVGQLLANVRALTDLGAVDYVVCNHAEPDHSGGLPQVLAALPRATLVCSRKCAETLAKHYDTAAWKIQTVKTGDTVSLGRRTLTFIETPMVHWPDSMFTYVPEEKLLFSMDGFGQHYASSHRFDDEEPLDTLLQEARTYYANIVMPYGKQVAKVLEAAAGLAIEMIAPSHGVIWRTHLGKIVAAYRDWAACRPARKVLVVYDTMWGSTADMAQAILDGASAPDVEAKLFAVRASDLTTLATEVLDTAAVAFGSATLNQGMMPMAAAVLAYWQGLKPVGKAGFAFGSYGWGRGGPEAVDGALRAMEWQILREPLRTQYRPTPAVLAECREAGRALADKARALTSTP